MPNRRMWIPLLSAAVAVGCATNPLSVRHSEPGTEITWNVASVEEKPEKTLERAWGLWMLAHEEAAARTAFVQATASAATRAEAEWALTLMAYMGGHPLESADHAEVCLSSARAPLLQEAVANLLDEMEPSLPDAEARVPRWRLLAAREELRAEARLSLRALLARMAYMRGDLTDYAHERAALGAMTAWARQGNEARVCVTGAAESFVRIALESESFVQLAVDGVPLIARDPSAAYLPTQTVGYGTWPSGAHELTWTQKEASEAAPRVTLTLADGRPASLASVAGPCATRAQVVPIVFHERVLAWPEDRLPAYFLAAWVAQRRGDSETAKRLIAAMSPRLSAFAPLDVLSAWTAKQDAGLPPEEAATRARAAFHRALAHDTANAWAKEALIIEALEKDAWEEALASLKELEKKAPENSRWAERLYAVASAHGWRKEADEAAQRVLALNPRAKAWLEQRGRDAQENGQSREWEASVTRLAMLQPLSPIHAQSLAARGRLDEALEAYRDPRLSLPEATRLREQATLLMRQGDVAHALSLLEGARGRVWFGEELGHTYADALLLSGRRTEAQETLRTLQEAAPSDMTRRMGMALLAQKPPFEDVVTERKAVMEAGVADSFGSDGAARLLLDEAVIAYQDDGSRLIRTRRFIQLQTREAMERYGVVTLPDGFERLRVGVQKTDGRFLLALPIGEGGRYGFPTLQEGDVLEIDMLHVVAAEPEPWAAWARTPFFFQSAQDPTLHARVLIIQPSGRPLTLERQADAPEARTITADGRPAWLGERRHIDALRPEPMMPDAESFMPAWYVSYGGSWDSLREAYRRLLRGRRRLSEEVCTWARETPVVHPATRADVRPVAERVSALVDGDDKENDFSRDAAWILASKRGNRVLALAAVLEALGVPNRVMLASVPLLNPTPPAQARTGAFDDAVLVVWPDSPQPMLYDGQTRFSTPDDVSPLWLQAYALDVEGRGVPLWRLLPARLPFGHPKTLALTLALAADGRAEGEAFEAYDGYYAAPLKEKLKHLSDKALLRFLESSLGQTFHGVQATWARRGGLDEARTPMRLHYAFRVQQAAESGAGVLLMSGMPFPLQLSESYMRTSDRRFPLLIGKMNLGTTVATIRLPPSYRLARGPSSQTIDSPYGRYRLEVEATGEELRLTRELAMSMERIEPAQLADFYRFIRAIDAKERESFRFEKSP